MEVNAEEGVVKYSKLIEQKAMQDNEPSLIVSQKTINKLKPEELVLDGIENNDYPANTKMENSGVHHNSKIKGNQQKVGYKPLVGLGLVFLMIVTGLIAGLFTISKENQRLKLQIQNLTQNVESSVQVNEDVLLIQNMSQSQIENFIMQNKNQLVKDEVTVKHLKNAIDDKGLLHDAIARRDAERVKLFLGLGANVNSKDVEGDTPLHQAVERNDLKVAEILLQNGANINARDKVGRTPLHDAASHGYPEIAKFLLQYGAKVNVIDNHENTPLHLAATIGNSKTVEVLLNHGARKYWKDNQG